MVGSGKLTAITRSPAVGDEGLLERRARGCGIMNIETDAIEQDSILP